MNNQDILFIPDTALISSVGDEMIILEINSGKYIEFNSVAGKIIDLIRAKKTIAYKNLLINLSEFYDIDINSINIDVEEFINQALKIEVLRKK